MLSHLLNLLLGLALDAPVLLAGELALVLVPHVEEQGSVDAHGEDEHAYGGAVAGNVAGAVVVAVEERGGHAGGVSDGDEDTAGKGSLPVARLVDGDPGHAGAGAGPEAGGDEEAADEAHGDGAVGEQEGVADNHDGGAADAEDAALLDAVAVHGDGEVGAEADNVDGDGEGVDLGGAPFLAAHVADDGGQEDAEAVEDGVAAELGKGQGPDLPVLDALNDVLLVHLLAGGGLANLGLAQEDEVAAVLVGEEAGRLRVVGEEPEDEGRREDGGDAVDGDDPAPGAPARGAGAVIVQLADAVGHEATDSARDGRYGVEVGVAQGDVPLGVEGGQVEHDAGEETGLEEPEEQTEGDEGGVVLDKAGTDSDDAPDEDEPGQVASGLHPLDDEVGRRLEQTVRDKENRHGELELVAALGHAQVLLDAKDTRITNTN